MEQLRPETTTTAARRRAALEKGRADSAGLGRQAAALRVGLELRLRRAPAAVGARARRRGGIPRQASSQKGFERNRQEHISPPLYVVRSNPPDARRGTLTHSKLRRRRPLWKSTAA